MLPRHVRVPHITVRGRLALSEGILFLIAIAAGTSAGCLAASRRRGCGAHVDEFLHRADGFQEAVPSAILRGEAQAVGAVGKRGGDDKDDFRGVVHHEEVVGDAGHGTALRGEGDAHFLGGACHAEVAAREGEGTSGGGGGVLRAGGGIGHAADVDGGTLLADDVDGGILDGLAQIGPHLEVHRDGVLLRVPGAVLDDSAEGGGGVVEARVDAVAAHEEAFDYALLQLVHVEDGLAAEAGVFCHHLADDALFIGGADGDGDQDNVFGVVLGDGVVHQLPVDLILDFCCHIDMFFSFFTFSSCVSRNRSHTHIRSHIRNRSPGGADRPRSG